MPNSIYTNGVIAVKESFLLGEKLLRFTEMSAEEVLRALHEGGFGSGAVGLEGEDLCRAEEAALDGFIREYAPSKNERIYLLAPRDFHNAKALCKAEKLGEDAKNLLAPEGMISLDALTRAIKEGEYSAFPAELENAVREVLENEELTGAGIGAIFDKALFKYLARNSKFSRILKKLLAGRADRTNILTAMRAGDKDYAEKLYVGGGILKPEALAGLFEANDETAAKALSRTPYGEFYALCLAAKAKGLPFTEAERALESYESQYFYEKRFELEGKQPFLYYVFRRRAEIQNVRIILVCLNAGLGAQDIRKRLRAI